MARPRKRTPPAEASAPPAAEASPRRRPARRCNGLDGRRWLQHSISVWSDIRKRPEELRLKHPALFPTMLCERLIETFLPPGPAVVLDPFAGTGSTLLAATRLGKQGIGLELSAEFVDLARARFAQRADEPRGAGDEQPATPEPVLHHASAARLAALVPPQSVDLCVTSPPYWNILNQQRTADLKARRHYGNLPDDLGTIDDYGEFLSALAQVFAGVLETLRPGAHCCVVVMDLRKKNRFFPFHSDLAARLVEVGFLYDDLIIWNRQSEYNNLRPLGYPSVFRVNKVHEFILLMQKPR